MMDVRAGETGEALGLLQGRALAAYLSLMQVRRNWAGRLVTLAASDEARAVAAAVVIVGGAVLWVDGDATRLRGANQAGLTDFNVTTLSEAIRILKNEIRKALPVNVGVLDAEGTVWCECVERGLQPDVCVGSSEQSPAIATLVARGALLLNAGRVIQTSFPKVQVEEANGWRERRNGDEALLHAARAMDEPDRGLATRWLQGAAKLFPRDTHRCFAEGWSADKGTG